ncbi:hypothetical protein CHS0354_006816 [Potamilus streckersoni]|uniref:Tape measure protein N-terminal domain-containing protein n=1 Tax=Potamilus streckersoni TaxID=2493646 RepID=A0AAE0WCY6_9BIVA|nr:hypothetical protein CHS0354_006816 [Potamilus streckersoni]
MKEYSVKLILDADGLRLEQETEKAGKSIKKLDRDTDALSRTFDGVKKAAGVLLAAFAVFETVRGFLMTADSVKALENRLRDATRTTHDFDAVYRQLADNAVRSGAALENSVEVFQRLAGGGAALGKTNSEILKLTALTEKLAALSGASAEAQKNGLTQFAQAMSAGTVRAEEYNSVMENLPSLAYAIADGLGVGTGHLRQMVINGELLSRDVFDAIIKQSGEINARFENTEITMGRGWQSLLTGAGQFIGALDTAADGTSRIEVFNHAAKKVQAWTQSTELTEKTLRKIADIEAERIKITQEEKDAVIGEIQQRRAFLASQINAEEARARTGSFFALIANHYLKQYREEMERLTQQAEKLSAVSVKASGKAEKIADTSEGDKFRGKTALLSEKAVSDYRGAIAKEKERYREEVKVIETEGRKLLESKQITDDDYRAREKAAHAAHRQELADITRKYTEQEKGEREKKLRQQEDAARKADDEYARTENARAELIYIAAKASADADTDSAQRRRLLRETEERRELDDMEKKYAGFTVLHEEYEAAKKAVADRYAAERKAEEEQTQSAILSRRAALDSEYTLLAKNNAAAADPDNPDAQKDAALEALRQQQEKEKAQINSHYQELRELTAQNSVLGAEQEAFLKEQQENHLAEIGIKYKRLEEKTKEALEKEALMKRAQNARAFAGYMSGISSQLSQTNRQEFELAKTMRTAEAVINTYAAANQALASYPPPWGAAAAAAVITSGLLNVRNIQQTQFNSGGGVSAPGGGALPPSGNSSAGSGSPADPEKDRSKNVRIEIVGNGGRLSDDEVRELTERIDEQLGNGVSVKYISKAA